MTAYGFLVAGLALLAVGVVGLVAGCVWLQRRDDESFREHITDWPRARLVEQGPFDIELLERAFARRTDVW